MRDIWVTPSKHEVIIHAEDPNAMERKTMHLTYREASILRDALSKVLEHPSHKGLIVPQSKVSKPVTLDGEGPNLRIVE